MDQSLHELWDRIDAGPPPLTDLTDEGDRVRRRRRRLVSVGAVTVVLALVGGIAAVQRLVLDDRAADTATSLPAPPDGMRWVGLGRVVVAVPDWWTTGETKCYTPIEDTVYFDPSVTAECGDSPALSAVREVSALAVMDATRGYGEKELRAMHPIGEVDGHEVRERDGCEQWFDGLCRQLFGVPSEGVVFAVTIAEAGDGSYEEIRDSVRFLPDGLTTVPLATTDGWTPAWGAEPEVVGALRESLERAGLRVDVVTAERQEDDDTLADYADFPEGSFLGVTPDLGSVVDVGSTVTVTVAGKPYRPER